MCRGDHGGRGCAVGRGRRASASAAPPAVTDAGEVTHWNQVAVATLAAVPGPNGGAHRRSRSTWAWCRVPCTTRSTRSGRSSIGRICSTAAPVRRRPPTPRSQRLPTTCSRSSSRRRPSGRRSRAGPDCWARSPPRTRPRSMRSTMTRSRGRASRWDTQRPRQCSTRGG